MSEKQLDKKLPVRNRVLLTLLSVLLVLLSLVYVMRNNFVSAEKTYLFLKEAQAFDSISDLTKETIRQNLPDQVKNNLIEKAIIEKLMDIVITPQNVAKIADPGIKAFYNISKKGASLADEQLSFNTTSIKSQAQQYIPSLGLPKAFVDASNTFVNATPDEINILNPKKNPNSPLTTFLKLREIYRTLNSIADILTVLIVINLLAIVAINVRSLKLLPKTLAWSFGGAAAVVLALSFLAPPIISLVVGSGNSSLQQYINNLSENLTNRFFLLVRSYGWLYLVIALLAFALHWAINSTTFKQKVSAIKAKALKSINKK